MSLTRFTFLAGLVALGTAFSAAPALAVVETAPGSLAMAGYASTSRAEEDVIAAVVAPVDVDYTIETPKVTVTVAPAPTRASSPAHSYAFAVTLTGHQDALDRCAGWVREDFGGFGRVVSAHNHCGGAVVLGMSVGDTVRLSGYVQGTYTVTGTKRVPKGASATVLEGGLWMQTCYFDEKTMRLVRLTPA